MGSPITFSGFNNIDFNQILNSVMQQESLPLTLLQQHQQDLKSSDSAFGLLASQLSSMQSATSALSSASTVTKYAATSSNTSAVSVSGTAGALPGHFDVVVSSLARAQVTAATTTSADVDSTVVATGGTLTIGGVAVNVTSDVTLGGLRDLINGTSNVPATASIVETAPGAFRLVLTGDASGTAHAFAIGNTLTGGAGIAFGTNAVDAANADLTVNNVAISSSSNTIDSGIEGVTLQLLAADASRTISVDVTRNDADLEQRLTTFVDAYNSFVDFSNQQVKSGALSHETVLRGLRASLRSTLTSAYGSGTFTGLAEVGIGFDRTGHLTLDKTALHDAIDSDPDAVAGLFTTASGKGAFGAVAAVIDDYVHAGGLLPSARTRIGDELSRLDDRIGSLQERLALRRAALQLEFTAADELMSRLNSQTGAISSLGSQLKTNS